MCRGHQHDKDFDIGPNEAYEYCVEFKTQKELDEIMADPDDMRMQALLIRERILGPTHPDTTYYSEPIRRDTRNRDCLSN